MMARYEWKRKFDNESEMINFLTSHGLERIKIVERNNNGFKGELYSKEYRCPMKGRADQTVP